MRSKKQSQKNNNNQGHRLNHCLSRRKVFIGNRSSKVTIKDFAGLPAGLSWFRELSHMIPRILGGRDLDLLADRIAKARRQQKQVIFMMGAHVVKCGLGGVIGELVRRKIVTTIAMNGACAIHDIEIALWGKTSEDVETSLKSGEFGMTVETAKFFNAAARKALQSRIGLGSAIMRHLASASPPNREFSILAAAHEAGAQLTVHVALGTDTVHQHDEADGRAIGFGTMKDFRTFAESIASLNGGVVVNLGSAVIMPEVFLKAIAIARSSGIELGNFTTANFDMHSLYRPLKNIIERPRLLGATSFNFIGQHEIMLPVFFASVLSKACLSMARNLRHRNRLERGWVNP